MVKDHRLLQSGVAAIGSRSGLLHGPVFASVPPIMTMARQELGKKGEELAVAALESRGYAIIARRYRTRCGEIDIVADDRGTLIFVEVKARANAEFGTAAEAVTPWKQRRLVRMARDYLTREQIHDRPCRFDVVAIMFDTAEPSIEVFVSAFDAY
jgi:putative endonuclease